MAVILGVGFLGHQRDRRTCTRCPPRRNRSSRSSARALFGDGTNRLLPAAVLHVRDPGARRQHRLRRLPPPGGDHQSRRLPPPTVLNRGDRLVFSNGILILAASPACCSSCFGGITRSIPLYAVGVFTASRSRRRAWSCTTSASRAQGWQRHAVINGIGAVATGVVSPSSSSRSSRSARGCRSCSSLHRLGPHEGEAALRQVAKRSACRPATGPDVARTGRGAGRGGHRATLGAVAYARSIAPDAWCAFSVASDEGPPTCWPAGRSSASTGPSAPLRRPIATSPGRSSPTSTISTRGGTTTTSRSCCPSVVLPLVGAAPAQPVGARGQGPPAVPSRHRRGVGAVPHRSRVGRRAGCDGGAAQEFPATSADPEP